MKHYPQDREICSAVFHYPRRCIEKNFVYKIRMTKYVTENFYNDFISVRLKNKIQDKERKRYVDLTYAEIDQINGFSSLDWIERA